MPNVAPHDYDRTLDMVRILEQLEMTCIEHFGVS